MSGIAASHRHPSEFHDTIPQSYAAAHNVLSDVTPIEVRHSSPQLHEQIPEESDNEESINSGNVHGSFHDHDVPLYGQIPYVSINVQSTGNVHGRFWVNSQSPCSSYSNQDCHIHLGKSDGSKGNAHDHDTQFHYSSSRDQPENEVQSDLNSHLSRDSIPDPNIDKSTIGGSFEDANEILNGLHINTSGQVSNLLAQQISPISSPNISAGINIAMSYASPTIASTFGEIKFYTLCLK